MLESVLISQGYRVATYNSPHIREFRERIRINGAPISGEEFCHALELAAKARAEMTTGSDTGEEFSFKTVFELLTATYFLAARQADADWLIVETGLGGRLDATNILDPGPVALTRIAIEHTHLLGDTMAEIAAEKAAILKPGGWAVAGRQTERLPLGTLEDGSSRPPSDAGNVAPENETGGEVFRKRAKECDARLDSADDICPLIHERYHPEGMELEFDFLGEKLRLPLGLYGPFIAENLQTCLAMIQRLAQEGLIEKADATSIATALAALHLPGRMQRRDLVLDADLGVDVKSDRPIQVPLFIDSAHCPAGARAVADTFKRHFPGQKAWAVVAMTEDKDHGGFFEELARWPGWKGIVCAPLPSPRSLGAEDLAKVASVHFKEVSAAKDMETALQFAGEKVEKNDMIVSAGSIFGIAGAIDWAMQYGRRSSSSENKT